jgi:hypothetical protein
MPVIVSRTAWGYPAPDCPVERARQRSASPIFPNSNQIQGLHIFMYIQYSNHKMFQLEHFSIC